VVRSRRSAGEASLKALRLAHLTTVATAVLLVGCCIPLRRAEAEGERLGSENRARAEPAMRAAAEAKGVDRQPGSRRVHVDFGADPRLHASLEIEEVVVPVTEDYLEWECKATLV
jgi:hypothetical protein